MLPAPYDRLYQVLADVIPPGRLVTDPLRTLAYGTDASFYRLIPKIVATVENEAELAHLLRHSRALGVPVTFRAAGTSLSGQAVSDSVLVLLGDGWRGCTVGPGAETIRLQPGVVGADANRRLAPHGRKIGPDPASINAAKIGGIAANNASGMCCGTAQNSYRTLQSMRVMLADGAVLDTADAASRAAFAASHGDLLARLDGMARRTRADAALAERIRHKFKIKNTTGYSLNALVDFEDPVDILQHLMIGSEGTLGFISEITYRTVPEHADKACALMLFPDVAEACRAVAILKDTPVAAVELMDRPALRSVEDKPGMPAHIRELDEGAAALLVETRGETPAALLRNVAVITEAVAATRTLRAVEFTEKPDEIARLWNIRKGLFPSVGAVRETGTTVIIEDVAVAVPRLAEAVVDLQALFAAFGYHEAIIFGHALEGNVHFVFTQGFNTDAEVERYARFMDAVCRLIVEKYDGSLKAEHGTGRNMAPYVELEWGSRAYALMREIKSLFDPDGLLNPGVILNDDHDAHVRDLKALPAADPIVDKCIECGFCEPVCPSHRFTLSPRQRIVGWREIARLAEEGGDAGREAALREAYDYQGIDTCAACGLCATACPVGIETGRLTKALRGRRRGAVARRVGSLVAANYGAALGATRVGLKLAGLARAVVGPKALAAASGAARRLSGDRLPLISTAMPTALAFVPAAPAVGPEEAPAVVYVPSCASRTMGPAADDPEQVPLPVKTEALLRKAGYRVVYPEGLSDLCCGMPLESKGLPEQADAMGGRMVAAIRAASRGGEMPVVLDTSPCAHRLKALLDAGLKVQDIVEFVHDHVLDRVDIEKQPGPVLLHLACSARKMGLEGKLKAIAAACAERVVVPEGVGCCGFAGDKGFSTPELNAHALRDLKAAVPEGCTAGYSSSRTCEIGLSHHSGMPYRSIVYLVDACARAKAPAPARMPEPAF